MRPKLPLAIVLLTVLMTCILTCCGLTPRASQRGRPVGLFPITISGKYGYIDKTGRIAIPPKYRSACDFSEGLALVMRGKSEKDCFINVSGEVVIELPPGIEPSAEGFSEGLAEIAIVKPSGSLSGYIDRSGCVAIRPSFASAYEFSDGRAPVMVEAPRSHGGLWGVIDRSGRMVVKPSYLTLFGYSEGLAAAEFQDPQGKWGYLDLKGNTAIQPQFECAQDFTQGLAAVQKGGKWGYIDKTGRWAIDPRFKFAGPFSEGLAGVGFCDISTGKAYGFIDRKGRVVVSPRYVSVEPFSEGLAAVAVRETKDLVRTYGYIDKDAKMVIPAQFIVAESFSNGIAQVMVTFERPGPSYIDKTGKFVWRDGDSIPAP